MARATNFALFGVMVWFTFMPAEMDASNIDEQTAAAPIVFFRR